MTESSSGDNTETGKFAGGPDVIVLFFLGYTHFIIVDTRSSLESSSGSFLVKKEEVFKEKFMKEICEGWFFDRPPAMNLIPIFDSSIAQKVRRLRPEFADMRNGKCLYCYFLIGEVAPKFFNTESWCQVKEVVKDRVDTHQLGQLVSQLLQESDKGYGKNILSANSFAGVVTLWQNPDPS